MESQIKIKKCTLVPNGCSLGEDYDIVRGSPIIDYYENINSPSISMTVSFIDIDQMLGQEGITGGELIDVTVQVDDRLFEIKSKEHRLMLNSVRDMITDTNKQFATLEFVSTETIINETARVNKKLTGNVSNTVKNLLVKGDGTDKKGIQSPKKLHKDDALNSYSFIGNLKRPFDIIQWLQPKAQSSSESFGFLFYETLDGYHFKSIEKLLEQEPFTYQKTDRPIVGNFKILENNLNQTNDIAFNLRMGMYANKTIYIDIENQIKSIVDFTTDDLKLKKPPKLLDGLEKSPTRLMLRVNDFGVAQKGSKKDDVQPSSELAVYQNKSYIRNNLLFSQSLQISIPFNPDLRVGQTINIKLPLKKSNLPKRGKVRLRQTDVNKATTDSFGDDKTNDPSGKYLISELRHLLGGGKGETQLTLVRDVFTA
tara:strand:- start:25 stop:1299 length:1275 start_codon:yes stop_codon:yes gene_type:complete